ncbi:hypothetical protein RFI_12977 [Reticulomyxa filosa]|uniref:RRM domain-containing protein n=1 Tax=Reticulomyxa filosa TaxID=46433 RepID=X6NDW7_RETFI|nr:hypothetical protein RFI_12977 [Reticulomyxa filosa]|eukprot:ETO24186.1 hypothetical protein RFI_12977 [Reticulomyxa filosa]
MSLNAKVLIYPTDERHHSSKMKVLGASETWIKKSAENTRPTEKCELKPVGSNALPTYPLPCLLAPSPLFLIPKPIDSLPTQANVSWPRIVEERPSQANVLSPLSQRVASQAQMQASHVRDNNFCVLLTGLPDVTSESLSVFFQERKISPTHVHKNIGSNQAFVEFGTMKEMETAMKLNPVLSCVLCFNSSSLEKVQKKKKLMCVCVLLHDKWVTLERMNKEMKDEWNEGKSLSDSIMTLETSEQLKKAKIFAKRQSQRSLFFTYSPLYQKFTKHINSMNALLARYCQKKYLASLPKQVTELIWEFVFLKTLCVNCSMNTRCSFTVHWHASDVETNDEEGSRDSSNYSSRSSSELSSQNILEGKVGSSDSSRSEKESSWHLATEQLHVKYYSFITWQAIGALNIPLPAKIIQYVLRQRYEKLRELFIPSDSNASAQNGYARDHPVVQTNAKRDVLDANVRSNVSLSTETDVDVFAGYNTFSRLMIERGFVSTTVVAFLSPYGILTALILDSQALGLKLDVNWCASYVNNSSFFIVGDQSNGFYQLNERNKCLELLPFDTLLIDRALSNTSLRQMTIPPVSYSLVHNLKWFFLFDIQDLMELGMEENASNQLVLLICNDSNLISSLSLLTHRRYYKLMLHVNDTMPNVYNSALLQLLSECKLGGVYIDVTEKRMLLIGYLFTTTSSVGKKRYHLKLYGFYVSYKGEISYQKEIWSYQCPLSTVTIGANRVPGMCSSPCISVMKYSNQWYLHFELRNSSDLTYSNSVAMELDENSLTIKKNGSP